MDSSSTKCSFYRFFDVGYDHRLSTFALDGSDCNWILINECKYYYYVYYGYYGVY